MDSISFARNLKCLSKFLSVSEWNCKLRTVINDGYTQRALLIFRQMKQLGVDPDKLTFPLLAKACGKLSNFRYGQMIHTHVVKSVLMPDIFVQTAMVDMYVKCDQLDFAHQLFEKMPERDVASWNVMIMGFAHLCLVEKVLDFFDRMRNVGFQPDSITVMGLTLLGSNAQNLNLVKAMHGCGIQFGMDVDVSVANTWIAAYAKCNDLDSSQAVFYGIPVVLRSVVSWNSMIAGYAFQELFIEAISFYQNMSHHGCRPDLSTMVSLISSCARPCALLQGKLIHCHVIQSGCDSDVCVINTLISMYSKCGDIDSARFLFNSMPERTRVSWTAVIGGYSEKGDIDEAFALFCSMEATGEKPDAITVVALLSACAQTGTLELGRWLSEYTISNGLRENVMVCNALIDMYSKCGSMNQACEVFLSMLQRTVVTWTCMISGYALNGEFKRALDLFSQMVCSNLRPNHLTFLAILQACAHAGLLEKGWECFNMMTKVYNINPRLEHYACMADLLGRKGKVEEALEFIQTMPIKPDAGVWGALLGACKTHKNSVIGEYAASRLFELEPQVAIPYVAIANIYASEGRWEGVRKIRAMMKSNKVRKSPGRSLVQVNQKVHAFTVEDRSHPDGCLIYEVLDGLALQLNEALDTDLDYLMRLMSWDGIS